MEATHLNGVRPEDRQAVQDVIRVINTLGKCSTWTVDVRPGGTYEVTGWLDGKRDTEVTLEDLDLLHDVNPLRVKAGLKLVASTGQAAISVRILSTTEPVMLQEVALKRIRKRSRWWGFGVAG